MQYKYMNIGVSVTHVHQCACHNLSDCRYVANMDAAEEPEHGRGAGCSFVMDSCSTYSAQALAPTYVCLPEWKDSKHLVYAVCDSVREVRLTLL